MNDTFFVSFQAKMKKYKPIKNCYLKLHFPTNEYYWRQYRTKKNPINLVMPNNRLKTKLTRRYSGIWTRSIAVLYDLFHCTVWFSLKSIHQNCNRFLIVAMCPKSPECCEVRHKLRCEVQKFIIIFTNRFVNNAFNPHLHEQILFNKFHMSKEFCSCRW